MFSKVPSKGSILGALSLALDHVEGQPEGHALRCAAISLRLGRMLGLSYEQQEQLFFACVIKDSGCTNNSVRIQSIFGGDEIISKRAVKFIDWSSTLESAKFALRHTERGNSIRAKLQRLSKNLGTPRQVMNEVTEARCTRGALIAEKLGLGDEVKEAVLYLDEHWDGYGAPYGISGQSIPLLARIVCLAQTVEVFYTSYGIEAVKLVVQSRTGTWFDPEVAMATMALCEDDSFWNSIPYVSAEEMIQSVLPQIDQSAIDADIDRICDAFAMIVDAKSNFTAEHSSRVTSYALNISDWFGLPPERRQVLRRAGLLHDVGKLGVSTSILEKPGRLTVEEFDRVKSHPRLSDQILRRISGFDRIADIASAHHERLDGKGYWRGLEESQLCLETRILTTADVFDALTASRPYRGPMEPSEAFDIMERDAGTAFDRRCLNAVWDCFVDAKESLLAA